MNYFTAEFSKRKLEINLYFQFIEIVSSSSEIICDNKKENHKIDDDLKKIIRANCFLLLYNLIESTIRNGIASIYECIENDSLTYDNAAEKIKKIYLLHKIDHIVSDNKIHKDTVYESIKGLIEDILNNKSLELQKHKNKLPISGNLNEASIQQLSKEYGFFGKVKKSKKKNFTTSDVLELIKSSRNQLAHGNKTFKEAVSNTTMEEMVIYKDIVFDYLNDVLKNIDNYINQKLYVKK